MSKAVVTLEIEGSASVVIHVVEGTAMIEQFHWQPAGEAPVASVSGQAQQARDLASGSRDDLAEAQGQYQEAVQEGAHAFGTFVLEWAVGFGCPLDDEGQPTVAQPDRPRLLNSLMANHGHSVLTYIRACGGLDRAVRSILSPDGSDAVREQQATALVGNMVQVSSLTNPFLSETWELYDNDPGRPKEVPTWLAPSVK